MFLVLLSSSTVAWFVYYRRTIDLSIYLVPFLAIFFHPKYIFFKTNLTFFQGMTVFFIQFIFKEYKLIKIYNLYQMNTKELYHN